MTNTSTDEFLEHFGVMGMKWGRRKEEGSGGSSSVGPSRSQEKVNKAKAKVEKVATKQKASDSRDKTILDARKNLAKSGSDFKIAKAQYKVDKLEQGKTKAKATLAKVKNVHMTNVHNANLSTAKELTDKRNEDFWNAVNSYASR